jgi:hypothetical protein
VADPASAAKLEAGRAELAALTRTKIDLVDEVGSDAQAIGPCAVVWK